jgi:hypothetical protein
MKNIARTIVLGTLLLGTTPAMAAQVSIGIQIGTPPRPRVVRVVPRRPAVEYVWIDGYWYPVGRVYKWHDGYWTRPPYMGARWVAPRYERGYYFVGYWEGDHGRFDHDHHWDGDHDRDFREVHDNGKHKGKAKGHGR